MRICCPFCSFQFESIQWLCSHLGEMFQIDPDGHGQHFTAECQFCSVNSIQKQQFSPNELTNHLQICHFNQQNVQHHSSTKNVQNVPKQHHRPSFSSHKCQFCSKTFKKSVDLKRHERTHTGERPFKCGQCSANFKLKQTLQTHSKVHQRGNNIPLADQHQCSICQKLFLSRSALKLHLRIHTGETPFKCAQNGCELLFRTKKLMMTHFRQMHQNNPPSIEEGNGNQILASTDEIEYIFEDFDEQKEAIDGLMELSATFGPKCNKNGGKIEWSPDKSAFTKYGIGNKNTQQQQPQMVNNEQQIHHHSHSHNIYCPSESSNQTLALAPSTSAEQQQKQHSNGHLADGNISSSSSAQLIVDQQFTAQNQQMFIRPTTQQIHHQMSPPLFYQMADAEYTSQGQVHARSNNPPPSQQFRTLTPPNFVYWLQ